MTGTEAADDTKETLQAIEKAALDVGIPFHDAMAFMAQFGKHMAELKKERESSVLDGLDADRSSKH